MGRDHELVQVNEPCCRSKGGGRDLCDTIEREPEVWRRIGNIRLFSVYIRNRK
jgi:hypothetical protein